MKTIIPNRLKNGDEIRVIALARSLSIVNREVVNQAKHNLESLGLNVTFGKNTFATGPFDSPSIKQKLEDLHSAFLDKNVKCIIVAVGGFNSNQLLDYIDWDIISNNPKSFCGFSDITVLTNAIFAKTGLQTYSSPNFYCFGLPPKCNYSLKYFKKALFEKAPYTIEPSKQFFDYPWDYSFNDRTHQDNLGPKIFYDNIAEGTIIGGNMCSLNLLNGTDYFPKIDSDIILALEDDCYDSIPVTFDRNLQAVTQQNYFTQVKGILIGRFQNETKFSNETLHKILSSKSKLSKMPIIYNLDFGHTDPKFTYPIGGKIRIGQGGSIAVQTS